MKPPKWMCLTVLLVLSPPITGCYTWPSRDVGDLSPSQIDEDTRWRLETVDGYRGLIKSPAVRDSVLVCLEMKRGDWVGLEIPVSSVESLKERRFSPALTVIGVGGAVLGAALVGFGLLVIAYATSGGGD